MRIQERFRFTQADNSRFKLFLIKRIWIILEIWKQRSVIGQILLNYKLGVIVDIEWFMQKERL